MPSVNIPVLNALLNAVTASKNEAEIKQTYHLFDKIIKRLEFFQIETKAITEKKTLSKADIIREQNTEKNIIIICDWLRKQFNSTSIDPVVYNGKFHEVRLLSMVIWAIKTASQTNAVNEYTKYDCLMSLVAAINTFEISSPPTTTIDLLTTNAYKSLAKFCSIERLFAEYSELIVSNTFTAMYPKSVVKPYAAQQSMIDLMNASLKENVPLFAQYSTETGSGKTYLSLALAQAHQNETSVMDRPKNAFIFTCYNEAVRRMIWELSNACHIPACKVDKDGYREYKKKDLPQRIAGLFTLNQSAINDKGISVCGRTSEKTTYDENGKVRKVGLNVRSRKMNGESIIKQEWDKFDRLSSEGSPYDVNIHKQYNFLLSADPNASFLANFPSMFICDPASAEALVKFLPDSTVFIDEPDVDDIGLAEHYANIVKLCPKRIIVASATVDDLNAEMDKFTEIWANRSQPKTLKSVIRSGTSGIHSTLSCKGQIYLPHMFVDLLNNSEEKAFHERLRNSSLIKLYSPLAISLMMKDIGALNKIEELDFRNINYETIRKFIIEFFENLDTTMKKKLQTQKLVWVNISKPLTIDAHHLSGQTLAINAKPFAQAKIWEDGLFNVMSNNTLYDLADAHKTFINEQRIYDSILEQILKNNTSKNKFRNGESKSVVEHKIAEHSQTKPSLYFPTESIIGSVQHCKRFAKHALATATSRIVNVDEGLYLNSSFELLQWLMTGVGFYDSSLHKSYIDAVLKDVSDHMLAMFISSPELIRGMDHRFENVLLNEDFLKDVSYSALKQSIGRVGRPGSSWGLIVIENIHAIEKLLSPNAVHEQSFFKQFLQGFVNRVEKKIEIKKVEKTKIQKLRPVEPEPESDEEPDDWEDIDINVNKKSKPKSKPISKPKPDDNEEW